MESLVEYSPIWWAVRREERGPKTSLCWLVGDQLHEFVELPSGGDNSYPGFVELASGRARGFLLLQP